MSRFHLLCPERIDNAYHGHSVALWSFGAITLISIGRSLVHILAPDGGAQSIATIPLDRMTASGASAVVLIFALWGLSQLLLGGVFALVLWRFRSLIPLMWLLVFCEYAGRFLIGRWKEIETLETPPGATANLVLPVVALIMLALSLRDGRAGGASPR